MWLRPQEPRERMRVEPPRGFSVERLGRRDNADFAALRGQAARWAADNFGKLADPDPKMPDLNDRAPTIGTRSWRSLTSWAGLGQSGSTPSA